MRIIILAILLNLSFCSVSHAQGTNNDFEFDETDFEFLFSKMGYGAFKFPVMQSRDQIFDLVVEEYRDGQLTQTHTALEIMEKAFGEYGLDVSAYAKPRMDSTQTDSVYFQRFYTERKDSILSIHIKSHGITTPVKLNIEGLATGDVRAKYETKEEIDEKGFMEVNKEKMLLFFYANKDHSQPLWCPAGMPKEKIIDNFYYTVFVYIKEVENF